MTRIEQLDRRPGPGEKAFARHAGQAPRKQKKDQHKSGDQHDRLGDEGHPAGGVRLRGQLVGHADAGDRRQDDHEDDRHQFGGQKGSVDRRRTTPNRSRRPIRQQASSSRLRENARRLSHVNEPTNRQDDQTVRPTASTRRSRGASHPARWPLEFSISRASSGSRRSRSSHQAAFAVRVRSSYPHKCSNPWTRYRASSSAALQPNRGADCSGHFGTDHRFRRRCGGPSAEARRQRGAADSPAPIRTESSGRRSRNRGSSAGD